MDSLTQQQAILERLRSLSPERIAEVFDFVEFLYQKDQNSSSDLSDQQLTQAATQLAQPSFQAVWDNPEDAVYDNL
ncbi:toxin-antitoxin system, antitoxin component, Xre family protein [Leptolyngbya sp. AN03gr2]|uniref:toxin-antitoxin system, antitoxin component, Xre family protein n=1 Tax=unclassified Leptolyngbya TaxID=2650499 RepID=UPI003D31EF50